MYAPRPSDPPDRSHPIGLSAQVRDAIGTGRHRLRVCLGDRCPHPGCGSRGARPWGGFSGRRRFRCRACGRTFSTFTGTPLHYVKRVDRWPAFTRCVDDQRSIRRTAKRLDIHPSTAFRWRHRLLGDWRRGDSTMLTGRVHLRRAWFAHSEKGRRPAGREARRHGYRYFSHIPPALRVQVALAWQRDDATLAEVSRPGDGPEFPARALFPRLADIEELLPEPLTPLPGLEALAAPGGVRVVRRRDLGGRVSPAVVMERSLRRWLRPFRGVATRYLPHYLQWFRSDLAEDRATLHPPPRPWGRSRGRRDGRPRPRATIPANRSRGSGQEERAGSMINSKNATDRGRRGQMTREPP